MSTSLPNLESISSLFVSDYLEIGHKIFPTINFQPPSENSFFHSMHPQLQMLFEDVFTSALSACRGTMIMHSINWQLTLLSPLEFRKNYSATSTSRWWLGCYIWYSEEDLGGAAASPGPSSLYQKLLDTSMQNERCTVWISGLHKQN